MGQSQDRTLSTDARFPHGLYRRPDQVAVSLLAQLMV